jgi:hypothetical protein
MAIHSFAIHTEELMMAKLAAVVHGVVVSFTAGAVSITTALYAAVFSVLKKIFRLFSFFCSKLQTNSH